MCATHELHRYLLAHCLNLIMKSNHLKYLLSQLAMSGCIARWLIQLSNAISLL